jgi:alpha-beta hydrolase superfamily lysophospholipase
VASDYSEEPYLITRALIEDGRRHRLLDGPISLHCPVRLLQGSADTDVPWQTATRLMERLDSADVETILVKDGDHRLSSERDLERLFAVLDGLTTAAGDAPYSPAA